MTALEYDLETLAREANEKPFDVVVVGGGSAGLTVARTLFEQGLTVAVLEAGPAPFLTHITNTDLRFTRGLTRNLRDANLYRPDLAGGGSFGTNYGCLGGRGLFWNGAAPRYSYEDLGGWPIDPPDLDTDYLWAEGQFRVGTSMGRTPLARRMLDRLAEAGLPGEPGPFAADIDDLYVGRLGSGIASGLCIFFRACGEAVAAGKVKVSVNSLVDRLLLEGGKVSGVSVGHPGGPTVEVRARAVVLAGGGIESIKLAVLSDVPDPGGRIGRGVQEHLFYACNGKCAALYDPAQRDSAIIYRRAPSQEAHQWEVHVPGNRLFAIDDGTPWQPDDSPPYQLMMRSFAATEKTDDNYIEARPGALGSSQVHFQYTAADKATMARIVADAARMAEALDMVPADAPAVDSLERFRPPGSSYHEAGGLDMGTNPGNGVTDVDGRFFAVPNLIAADAAAFPRIGATNPHLTIVAVARRKARALAQVLS
ncbi:MAG: FAD-dependent oxidoreductase [Allosphingosinicella sp.]